MKHVFPGKGLVLDAGITGLIHPVSEKYDQCSPDEGLAEHNEKRYSEREDESAIQEE